MSKQDQEKVFPQGRTFESPEEQEKYIREWTQRRTVSTPFLFTMAFKTHLLSDRLLIGGCCYHGFHVEFLVGLF